MIEFERIQYSKEGSEYVPASPVRPAGLQTVPYSKEDVLERFPGIDRSFAIVSDKETSLSLELAIVNPEFIDQEFTGFGSTFGSALTINDGNTKELGMHGAEQPHVAMAYFAHPGAGGSSNLLKQDAWRLLSTGRFTDGAISAGDLRPTESMLAHARMIKRHLMGRTPSQFTANESGARYVLGLMAALDKNSVERAHLNGPPGISAGAKYATEMWKEDRKGERERKQQQQDYAAMQAKDPTFKVPVTIDSFTGEEMKKYLPRIYAGRTATRRLVTGNLRRIPTLAVALRAYSGHDDLNDVDKHAFIQDNLAALQQQEATIVWQVNRGSRIHNVDDAIRAGKLVMDNIPEALHSEKRGVELLIGTGSLDAHTSEPSARAIAERMSLTNVAQFMRVVFRREKGSTTYEPSFAEPHAA